MSNDNFPNRPKVTFDFNLPHGLDTGDNEQELETLHGIIDRDKSLSDAWSFDQPRDDGFNTTTDVVGCSTKTQSIAADEQLRYRQFSQGFSDDEGSGEAFERSWPSNQARKLFTDVRKGKKSPRRSDTDSEGSGSSGQAKKPRQSLFGGAVQVMELKGRDDHMLPSLGSNIGSRMSSLNIDQQEDDLDDLEKEVDTGFRPAWLDIGSVRSSPALSDDEFLIPADTMPCYELRQNIDRKKAVTHVDNDTSGNFDPDREAKDRAANLVRARAAKKEKKAKNGRKEKKEKIKGKGRIGATLDLTLKCIVKLPFESFGNVRNLTDEEQNWPDDWSEIDTEQEREFEEFRRHYRARSPNLRPQRPLEDPAGETDDLTGHPAARGCKQCRKLEQGCSLIHGGRYPCEECLEDGSECHLIQEPTMKDRCKQCDLADEEVCSFENNPTQQTCDHCTDNGLNCEALPPKGYKAPRMSVDEIVWGPDRPSINCTTCRRLNKRCSLKTKKAKPPCKWCKKTNDPCRFVDPIKPEEGKQTSKGTNLLQSTAPNFVRPRSKFFTAEDIANMYHSNNVVVERQSTPEMEMEDAEGNRGMLTKITTSFAHPMSFGAPRSELMDCNFCEIPIFGMFGHFEREVHVIRWHSNLGFSEVGGGHAQNEGPTNMCSDCTNQRLQIMVCPGHEFERIPDAVTDHDALAEELISAEPGGAGMQYQLTRWCSMCFSPAVFGCCTVQSDLCGEEEKEIAGCHLRLCFACEVALRTQFGNDLDAMVADLESQPKVAEADEALGRRIEGRPRADVGLLMQDSLLMQVSQAGE